MYIPYLYMPGNKQRTLTTFLMDYANAQQGSWQTLAAGIIVIMLPTAQLEVAASVQQGALVQRDGDRGQKLPVDIELHQI